MDLSASGLVQGAWFELLTLDRQSVDLLDGVRSMSVERNFYATPMSGASIDFTVRDPLDLTRRAVRIWAVLSLEGVEEQYPIFTGIPMIAGQSRTAASARVAGKLLDFTRNLDVPVGRNYTVVKGDLVTSKMRELCLSVGALDASITESSSTVGADMYFPPTETKRKIINTLAAAIGYRSVWADEWGKLRIEPYLRPADRPVIPDLGFIHGKTCTYRPEFTIEHDVSNVPNHAVVTTRMAFAEIEPAIGEAWLPADHPYSYDQRGIEIPFTEADVELAATIAGNPQSYTDATAANIASYRAAMKTLADAYALRKLYEGAQPSRSFTVENRWRPCDIADVTRFVAPARLTAPAIDTRVSIVKDSVRYEAGQTLKVTTTLQEVM